MSCWILSKNCTLGRNLTRHIKWHILKVICAFSYWTKSKIRHLIYRGVQNVEISTCRSVVVLVKKMIKKIFSVINTGKFSCFWAFSGNNVQASKCWNLCVQLMKLYWHLIYTTRAHRIDIKYADSMLYSLWKEKGLE